MVVEEYDFVTKYCKATENRVADILSHCAPVEREEHICENTDVEIMSIKYEELNKNVITWALNRNTILAY